MTSWKRNGQGQVRLTIDGKDVLAREGQTILEAARGNDCDFIITGGFGLEGLFDVIIGSILDEVLRTAEIPVLVCR